MGLIIQFSGVDAAKYDAIVKEAGRQRQEGRLASGKSSAMQLVQQQTAGVPFDVWSSQAQFDRFFSKRLKPAFDRAGGMPEPPP